MIVQRKRRCWVLADGPRRHEDHFINAVAARKYAQEHKLPGQPERLAEGCWTVECDGGCETVIDQEGECYIVHSDSRAEAEKLAADVGWTLTVDGLVICDYDAQPEPVQA